MYELQRVFQTVDLILKSFGGMVLETWQHKNPSSHLVNQQNGEMTSFTAFGFFVPC